MKHIHIATYQDAAKKLADVLPVHKDHPIVVRLGGSRDYPDYPIQINSAQAIKNSINKLEQKNLLFGAGLSTLPLLLHPEYPCIIKGIVRSMGTKVFIINTEAEFAKAKIELANSYMLEPLFKATGEYRLHCTRDAVFFAVKKIKNDPNDVIINAKNHYNIKDFIKPRLWEQIKTECIRAMVALDLDIACFDVMYNSSDDAKHEFTIAEANTNPELLANTFNAYVEALKGIIARKIALLADANKRKAQPPVVIQPAVKPEQAAPVVAKLEVKILTEAQKVGLIRKIMDNEVMVDDQNIVYITL